MLRKGNLPINILAATLKIIRWLFFRTFANTAYKDTQAD
jgi:hypothetical protein